ncbi:protoporphyrinogen oxidase [Geoalkalibacter ferrihydriticus]|uniref:Coproporphyrinogen III oxidase n=2 Tax=Geoalkalibacter ferrihydriticus TaxID=392333 RepID=A0A0C2DRY0_9BACT|nr:protoporphyrinogen oxidase [Geoalkalibacter ferrihydriticus]KIH76204.1 protoporphyrinogen oxidase [Geoalkalibacter ferrihydriticus DSM 17813]SDL27508.1 protoporphyrinogen oxidase [Geoalkalibacter ferrihydriticus]
MTRIAIIGAGISGLTTAFLLERQAQAAGLDLEIVVLEKKDRIGGKIWSIRDEGFLCEWGPNGFLDSKPWTLELCEQLDIRNRLLRSDDNARKRYIFSEGVLHRLPENGAMFLKSKLISWPGKLRLSGEMLIPAKRDGEDETLADFGRRRLGAEALDKLIAPMVSGIFAGDPETMSLKSCFPRIQQLEEEYGGLVKAMVKLAKKKKKEIKEGKQVASAAGPGGVLTSFTGGIQELTDGTAVKVRGEIRKAASIERILRKDGGFELRFEGGGTLDADVVVSAAPAHALAEMAVGLDDALVTLLNEIPYAPMNVICFGYERDKVAHSLDGFGYLIPRKEGCSTLGTLWDSSIFPNRAPEGMVLLRSMMGGAANPGAIEFSDAEVRARTLADLNAAMGIAAEPDFVRIFRHPQAIPQYIVGHAKRLAALDERLQDIPGLYLTGNAFYGIGLNDCVHASHQVVERVIQGLNAKAG